MTPALACLRALKRPEKPRGVSEPIRRPALAVFAGGFTAEAAEEVCKAPRASTASARSSNTACCAATSRATASRASRCSKPSANTRPASFELALKISPSVRAMPTTWRALAERAEPDALASRDTSAFDLLELEHDNLRAAVDWRTPPRDTTSSCGLPARCGDSGSCAVTGPKVSRGSTPRLAM